ncbi:peptide ABC transporter permease [Hahella sp. CCB-MM4]|uniref:ABC transporter permease n=1 Tax=Hahella sp. (strain CCB-MM4) TaxID=1926491 RepID=UPI000B9BF37F|nr:ABC transporter permease [Hahella sp. CCB-MM4]OZG69982.1 peptide ABC transporter permease [Hahella sp. CCB-MM4]
MTLVDMARFNWLVVSKHRFRTAMVMLALVIGVSAVNLLIGLGEGARLFILGEFSFLGKNTLIVMPGKKETTGGMPPITGESPRDITLQDSLSVQRLPEVRMMAPLVVGFAELSYQGRLRESLVVGTSQDFMQIRKLEVQQGQFLPDVPLEEGNAVAVIGRTLKRELFGPEPALGRWLRAGDRRFRVIGVLSSKGMALGMDFDEVMIVPVASAQALFNQEGLFRVFAEVRSYDYVESAKERIASVIRERHDGEEDVTVITQDALLASFDKILQTLTLAVGGVAAISLVVAGVLIMNVMLISVSQRTDEIGLLKALGADAVTIERLFLSEAVLLALLGGATGLLLSESLLAIGRVFYPNVPLGSPLWAKTAAFMTAILTALIFAWLPSRRASAMEPVAALNESRGV